METTTPEQAPEPDPEQVIAWLRTEEGERWSRTRIRCAGHGIAAHDDSSGLFADVFCQPARGRTAFWPEPGPWRL